MAIYTDDVALEACWRFDNDLTDESANGDDLSQSGTVSYSSTDPPQGTHKMVLAGSGTNYAYITDANLTGLDFSLSAWSLTFWIDPVDAGGGGVRHIIVKDDAADRGFFIAFRLDDIRIEWGTGASTADIYATTSDAFSDNAVHHVAVTWNGTTLRFYVDASEDTSGDFPATPGANCRENTQDLEIGASLTISGFIDEVAFFSRELSSTDVADIYNNHIQDPAGPVTFVAGRAEIDRRRPHRKM
jgi:hypothetical protein